LADSLRYAPPFEDYVAAAKQRVLVYDGATGTNLQVRGLTAADFGGPDLEGCNELLNLTRPDVIAELHASFLDVGVDIVETNTFGAFAVPLAEYGLADQAYEIARAGAEIARRVVDDYTTRSHPRWVAGSIGPGTKFASLGQIRFAELRNAYQVQARGLLDGGVDLFIVETFTDFENLCYAYEAARAVAPELPIIAQMAFLERTGSLTGAEPVASLIELWRLGAEVIGINCGRGPPRTRSTGSRSP
jgi:5-methyltetrahydrofolate--homocysteine methyltransferase